MVEIDEMLEYHNLYEVRYKIMDVRGRIVFKNNTIYLNPMFNQDAETYIHELFHHHYDYVLGESVPESEIEKMAQEFYNHHRLLCEKLVKNKTTKEKFDLCEDWD